jgi:hypothetical protein
MAVNVYNDQVLLMNCCVKGLGTPLCVSSLNIQKWMPDDFWPDFGMIW